MDYFAAKVLYSLRGFHDGLYCMKKCLIFGISSFVANSDETKFYN